MNMEETLTNLAPALIQLESDTAVEIVRQVMIYKYVELGLTLVLCLVMVVGFGLFLRAMMRD